MKRAQLEWRCRRGMKELDLLLERYLELGYDAAPLSEQAAFAHLAACSDDDLKNWLLNGHLPEDATLAALVRNILSLPHDSH
jgi:antitoxin CptB